MTRAVWLVSFALLLCACADDEANVIVGTLERDRLELVAEANEPIVEIAVREGDTVAPGAILMKLDSQVAQARVDEATAAIELAEGRLAELVKGPREQEIQEARAALESTTSAARTAQNEFTRVAELVERRLLSESQLDAVRAQRDAAASAVKQARLRLDLLLEGTRRESIEQAQAELKRAQASLIEVTTSLARHVITAPRAGIIEALPFKLGERAPAGAPLVIMLADGAPYARVYVPEPHRAQFTAGAQVYVSVDGVEREFVGTTRFVAAEAQFTPYFALTQEDRSRLSYLAEIDLNEADARSLPSGIPVQVRMVPQ